MLVDSPTWVRHGHADGIAAIDVSPNGRRLATCGAEPQIVLWNLEPVLDAAAELNPAVHKKLAVLQEHNGFVLAVKWSHSGALLASGGSDTAVLVYKRSAAPASGRLNSSFVNVENWRPVACLKGHSLDVTALSWLPGDSQLASSSMDGSIRIWSINEEGRGSQVHAILGQHNGWVKGLAFDPIGRYLASQGRNGLRVWDTHCGWACVAHMAEQFTASPEAGFKYRISWSPDGEGLTAVNANEAKQPIITYFSRQEWSCTSLVGHRGSVLVAASNPRMFFPPKAIMAARQEEARQASALAAQQGDGEGASGGGGADNVAGAGGSSAKQQQRPAAAAAAAAAAVEFEDTANWLVACGSNDRSLTVWASGSTVPLLCCKQMHAASIVDVAWTPDGYTLICAGGDDRMTVMRFARRELGRALTDAEFKAVLEREYGSAAAAAAGGGGPGSSRQPGGQATPGGGARGGAPLADAADAAALAALSAADAALTAGSAADIMSSGFPSPGGGAARAPAAAAAPLPRLPPAPAAAKPAAATAAGRLPAVPVAGALERRLMPQGAGITTSTLQAPAARPQQQAGQKRIHPVSTGAGPAAAAAAAAGGQPAGKRLAVVPVGAGRPQQQQQVARVPAPSAGGGSGWLLEPPAIQQQLQVLVAEAPSEEPGSMQQQPGQQHVLRSVWLAAANSGDGSAGGSSEVSLFLNTVPGELIWRDALQERVVALAGTALFMAAATETGLLYTWRNAGNQLLPPVALGCPPVSMSSPGGWQLQVVGVDGGLVLLDVQQKLRLISGGQPQPNLAAILGCSEPGTTLFTSWVTRSSPGPPAHLAVLTDGSCWMFQAGLGLWLMLQPPASAATAAGAPGAAALPSLTANVAGELGRVRAAVAAAAAGTAAGQQQAARLLPLPRGPGLEAWQRRHAALQCSTAELLGDAPAYRNWLGMLANVLAKQERLGQLRELAQDLLGPKDWLPAHLLPGPCPYALLWRPTVCGLPKRALLGEILVPAMARNRLPLALQVQRALEAAQECVRQREQAAQQQQQGGGAIGSGGAAAGGIADLLRLGAPAGAAAPGDGDAAAAAAAAAAGGGAAEVRTQQQQHPAPHRDPSPSRDTEPPPGQQVATGEQGRGPPPAVAAAMEVAPRAGSGTHRRVQPVAVEPPANGHAEQQQGLAAADAGGGAAHANGPGSGTNSGGRTPLQEHQQPHNVPTSLQQQQQQGCVPDKSGQQRSTSGGSLGQAT